MKVIGGFFDLELPSELDNTFFQDAIRLSTGRACINLWIKETNPNFCYVPFYCCDALFQPLIEQNISFEFYSIDKNFIPIFPKNRKKNSWLIWTNYFGLLNNKLDFLQEEWGTKILIDNTHSFFKPKREGFWSFTSARKYFGVSDGAFCFGSENLEAYNNLQRFIPNNCFHLLARYTKISDEAFELYQASEREIDSSLKKISIISERILNKIDFEKVKEKRINNYNFLFKKLQKYNLIDCSVCNKIDSPFCFPFWPEKFIQKEDLYKNKIYVATLWPDVFKRKICGFDFEVSLAKNLLPLPIDHRYTMDDMKRIVSNILKLLK